MTDWGAVGGFFGTMVVLQGAAVGLGYRSAAARTAHGVISRLQKPGAPMPYSVTISNAGAAWNPAKPLGPDNGLWGKARASYWLSDDGLVRLLYEPQHGEPRHLTGFIPSLPRKGLIVWAVLGAYALAAAVGFVVSYSVTEGSSDHRLGMGVFGAMAGFVAVWFVALWSSVGRAIRRYVRGTGSVPSSPPAAELGPATSGADITEFEWPTGASYADLYRAARPQIAARRRQVWLTGMVFVVGFVGFLVVPADYDVPEDVLLLVCAVSILWFPVAVVRLVRWDRGLGRR